MQNQLITIILATKDNKEAFNLSLDSILKQSYPNKEIIVANYGKENFLIEGVKTLHYPSLSVGETFNRAIKEGKGRFLLLLLSGHEIHRRWLEVGLNELLRVESDAIRCATMYSNGKIEMPKEGSGWGKNLWLSPSFELSCILFKKEIASTFEDGDILFGQWEFWIKSLSKAKLFALPEYVGAFVPIEKESTNIEKEEFLTKRVEVMEKYSDYVKGSFNRLRYNMKLNKLRRRMGL